MRLNLKFPRRDFLKLMAVTTAQLASLSIVGAVYGTSIEPAWLEIETVTLDLRRLHPAFNGFRITQISDIHMGGWMDRERFGRVIDLVKGTHPDLIVITGDFIESTSNWVHDSQSVRNVQAVLSLLNFAPVMAVLGNHDYDSHMNLYLRSVFSGLKFIDLTNKVHTLARGEGQLHFAGVDDILLGLPDLPAVLAKLPGSGAAILLVHEPDFADVSSMTGSFDLQISGHSHGGQVVLPLIGPPALPQQGTKYINGLYRVGRMLQYTNRGVGMTAPYIRFNCRPEITVFTLKAGESG
jgi:predicted MPP superfamily phosphohydrolase